MEEASGSSQPQVLVNANKHEQTKPINTGMDYDSYNAAKIPGLILTAY